MDAVQWKLNVIFVAGVTWVIWNGLRQRKILRQLMALKGIIERKRAAAQQKTA